jgi:hypothetical protein
MKQHKKKKKLTRKELIRRADWYYNRLAALMGAR